MYNAFWFYQQLNVHLVQLYFTSQEAYTLNGALMTSSVCNTM